MDISQLNINSFRNKTIQELKKAVFENKKQLEKLHTKKNQLNKIKEKKLSPIGPIELIYDRIFNEDDKTIEEFNQCVWDEDTVKENLEKLEKEIRMKELVKINDWWLAHEEIITKIVPLASLRDYKNAVFQRLITALEKDEVTFIQVADKTLLELIK